MIRRSVIVLLVAAVPVACATFADDTRLSPKGAAPGTEAGTNASSSGKTSVGGDDDDGKIGPYGDGSVRGGDDDSGDPNKPDVSEHSGDCRISINPNDTCSVQGFDNQAGTTVTTGRLLDTNEIVCSATGPAGSPPMTFNFVPTKACTVVSVRGSSGTVHITNGNATDPFDKTAPIGDTTDVIVTGTSQLTIQLIAAPDFILVVR